MVLLEAGGVDLSFDEVAARCGSRLRDLLSETCRWAGGGHGRSWKPGDYAILIVETTAAVDAVLYVQFWSEPIEPVEWEVCSGRANPGALPFVGEHAQKTVRAFGFDRGGGAQNFRKQATFANSGDVQAAAHETLRIFVEALGYRGRTALVARIIRHTHAEAAWVYRSVSVDDVQKMLWHGQRSAQKAPAGKCPVLNVEHDGVKYAAVLFDGVGDGNRFECVDLRTCLGRIRRWGLASLNTINGRYRTLKAYMDEDRDACVVLTISFEGGLTEEAFRVQVDLFERVLRDPAFGRIARSIERTDARAKREAQTRKGKGENAVVH